MRDGDSSKSVPDRSAEHRRTVRSLSVGTVWRFCRYPFTILSAIIIPKIMGPEVYGRFAVFMSIYLMLDTASDVGVTQTFGRYVPELKAADREKATRLLHAMLVYGVGITLLVIVFGGVPSFFFGDLDFRPSWWVVLCSLLVLTKVEGTLFASIYGDNQIGRYSFKELLRSAATFVFVTICYLLWGLTGALWGLVLAEVALLLVSVTWCRQQIFSGLHLLSLRAFRPYFVFGLKFYAPMLVFVFLQRSGNILVWKLTGSEEQVTYFDLANQYLLLTATFLGLGLMTLLPALTSFYTRGEHDNVTRWHTTAMKYCTVVAGLAALALAGLGRPLLILCLGTEFAPVYPVALVMSLVLPLSLVAYAGQNFALLEKRSRVYTASVTAGLACLAVGCVLLVPRWGAVGAAWASVAGYGMIALVLVSRYSSEFGPMLAPMAGAFGSCVLCALPMLWGPGTRFAPWVFPVSVVLYLGLVTLLGIVRLAEIRQLVSILKGSARSPTGPSPEDRGEG